VTQVIRQSIVAVSLIIFTASCSVENSTDPLPSWRAGDARASIMSFVEAVSDPQNADYVGPVLRRSPEIEFVNDGPGKPIGIQRAIGRRPIFAFGNSDGDLQMLQWAVAGETPGFAAIVHHTDGDREWAYDRDSHIGRLDKALDEAGKRGWTVVDMKTDWAIVHPAKTN
jgi:hypothetical protein